MKWVLLFFFLGQSGHATNDPPWFSTDLDGYVLESLVEQWPIRFIPGTLKNCKVSGSPVRYFRCGLSGTRFLISTPTAVTTFYPEFLSAEMRSAGAGAGEDVEYEFQGGFDQNGMGLFEGALRMNLNGDPYPITGYFESWVGALSSGFLLKKPKS